LSDTAAWDSVAEAEALGIRLRLIGDRVRATLPEDHPDRVADVVERLRANREEVAELLRMRATVPPMPSGVRAHCWNLKAPPIAIDSCSIVTDCDLFARTTLEQLRIALAEPRRWVGWTLPQLIDRLRQVGVDVEIEGLEELSQLRQARRDDGR
jgi:hypothetical protein